LASDKDALQFDDAVRFSGFSKRWGGNVINGNAGRSLTIENAVVGVKLCAPEEMIWMKAYIMERERFDGADVAHILQSCADKLDWPHLVRRFGLDWRVLLSHLVLFGYIYPGERDKIPNAIMDDLIARLRSEKGTAGANRICNGTLLSRKQYLLDVRKRGFRDARLLARVHMNAKDIAHWTRAIAKEENARGNRA
jgi:hypothetical protein